MGVHSTVVLLGFEITAADHRHNMTAVIIDGNQSTFYGGRLLPLVGHLLGVLGHLVETVRAQHGGENLDTRCYRFEIVVHRRPLFLSAGNVNIFNVVGQRKQLDNGKISLVYDIEAFSFVAVILLVYPPVRLFHNRVGDPLVIQIEGSMYNITVLIDIDRTVEHVVQLEPHIFAEVGGLTLVVEVCTGNVGTVVVIAVPVALEGAVGLFPGSVTQFDHLVEHILLARLCPVGVVDGGVERRTRQLDYQDSRLGNRKLTG